MYIIQQNYYIMTDPYETNYNMVKLILNGLHPGEYNAIGFNFIYSKIN